MFGLSFNAYAETSPQELAAIAKIVSLSKDIPAGDAAFAVVYDPSSAASNADLAAIKGLIGDGYKAPKHMFKLEAVPVDNVSGSSAKILFMTEGLSGDAQKKILTRGVANQALTVTTSLPYVEGGNCVLGVDVGSGVKIIMHSESYSASKLNFDSAFKFMIKEI
tara:strand:+ start:73941 stop:74432 length:492 start_codon:yes stop_codon:yes gene_type:complete